MKRIHLPLSSRRHTMLVCVLALFLNATTSPADSPVQLDSGTSWPSSSWFKPPEATSADEIEDTLQPPANIHGIYLQGPSYRGHLTTIFCWYGVPSSQDGKSVPGIILVHGGGGTAYATWVEEWNKHGYAAIAVDTSGCAPLVLSPKDRGKNGRTRERHANAGPSKSGGFDQMDEPDSDHWSYHAVAAIILAHSFLADQSGVDPQRIAITGISWGGYLTCLVTGLDPRLKFAIPVYGCGHYTYSTKFSAILKKLSTRRAQEWITKWDPSNYLMRSNIPMLWVDGTNDIHFPMPALKLSYLETQGPYTLTTRVRMPHSHPDGMFPPEIYAFADQYLKGAPPLARVIDQGRKGNSAWAQFEVTAPLRHANFNYTTDTGDWDQRKWLTSKATIQNNNMVEAEIPEGTSAYFFNATDTRGLTVSTEHQEVRQN